MNIAMWILAGAALGWMGFSYWGFNEERGPTVSIIIGAAGGLLGGNVVAPIFLDAGAMPGDFSAAALFFAVAVAATFLFVGNLVYNRWGI